MMPVIRGSGLLQRRATRQTSTGCNHGHEPVGSWCQPGIDAIESKQKTKDNHLAMTQSAPMALRIVFKSLFASLFLDSVYFWTVLPYFRSSFKQQRIIRRRAIPVDIPRMYDIMTYIMYYIPILMAFRVF